MKTLILNDDLWDEIERVLTRSTQGRAALLRLDESLPPLPEPLELIALARAKGDPPERVRRLREYRDAGRQAAADTRAPMTDLVRDLYAAGVGGRQISRWTGLKEARVYEIVSPAQTSV